MWLFWSWVYVFGVLATVVIVSEECNPSWQPRAVVLICMFWPVVLGYGIGWAFWKLGRAVVVSKW